MKTIKRILLGLLILVVLFIIVMIGYFKLVLPKAGEAPDIQIELTQERIERGEYLANNVAACMDCHSVRDYSKFAGPLKPETFGTGGEVFDQTIGLPGSYISKNLTPANLGDWTDGEIFRAITAGVNKDGEALFPIMPYPNYAKLDKEDIYSIIAYLRNLEPKESDIPESKSDFPMSFIINTIPKEPALTTRPSKTDKIKYGEYLTTMASCIDCHTTAEKGKYNMDMFMAGGMETKFPTGGTLMSANISPHKETGIGSWTENQFIQRFKSYEDSVYTPPAVNPNTFTTIMPWLMYSGMTDEDLSAIFAYLQSIPAIENNLVRFTPSPESSE